MPEQNLQASGPDEYAYVTVPTNFTEDKWVIAAELRPGNRKVVHHAHVFVIEPEERKPSNAEKDPGRRISKVAAMIRQGRLNTCALDAPVIDDGCAVDDNGAFPGDKADRSQ